jgi:prepilin-type N-terminal cleavage/methylation domain-containing protein
MHHLNAHKLIRQKDRGFTLIEMLAVLMIVGVLMAIATPSVLAMMSRAKLTNAVDRVRDTLELSRSQTTQKNKKCNVYIPTGNQIVSDCLVTADSTSSGITGVTDGLPSVKLDDKDDILIENSDSAVPLLKITYNFKGITQNSGTVILSSRDNPTGEKKCLIVEAGIGLVRTGKYINNACQVGE